MASIKRIIAQKMVAGTTAEDLANGTGRICIHLLVRDERGPIIEPHAIHPAETDSATGVAVGTKLMTKPTRMRLACDRKMTVTPVTRGGVTTITHRTEEPRAVTCQKCVASVEYKRMSEALITEMNTPGATAENKE